MGVTVFAGKVTRVTMDGVFADFGGLLVKDHDSMGAKPGDDIVCSIQLVTPPKAPEVQRPSDKGRPSVPGT